VIFFSPTLVTTLVPGPMRAYFSAWRVLPFVC